MVEACDKSADHTAKENSFCRDLASDSMLPRGIS